MPLEKPTDASDGLAVATGGSKETAVTVELAQEGDMEAKRRLKEEQAKAKHQADALPVWISQSTVNGELTRAGVCDSKVISESSHGVLLVNPTITASTNSSKNAEDANFDAYIARLQSQPSVDPHALAPMFDDRPSPADMLAQRGLGTINSTLIAITAEPRMETGRGKHPTKKAKHLLNLGALVDSPVTHQEHKGIIAKLYDFYKRCLETEPGEEEPQVPSATELCSVLPNIQADDPSITTTQAEEPSITTTQAAEIEASSDSVSKTIKHQLSHQSIQNTLPPIKRHSKRLQALPKTQAGRVLQGFQSSYSLRNPTGQGLIPQGGIPISAKDCEQIQENENSIDNVLVTQENPNEQPLFRDEEQLESETQVPTEEAQSYPAHNKLYLQV
ncbi:hypothetical protein BY996DRAFT_8393439 [Phakopsora pachyrhizi]|nr:hypothetical protein BY996DRAFT_8393439 [Phakopsora pachyrhizi]